MSAGWRTSPEGARPLWPWATDAIGFRPEFLDFRRGIRVGNLEPHERITRILKLALEARYAQPFLTERWGRGVYWRWIGYLPRANREAKPISRHASFGCAKFFLLLDTEKRLFKCGMQVERGYLKAPAEYRGCELRPDWDWHRLLKALRPGSRLEQELKRLVQREGFLVHAGSWEEPQEYSKKDLPGAARLRRILAGAPPRDWSGFQVYYAMEDAEVRASTGADLVGAMLAVFSEVAQAASLCMQVVLEPAGGS